MSSDPVAIYDSPETTNHKITIGEGDHTTNGKTTQISDIVIKAGGQDRDKPTEGSNTYLGQLRAKVTSLQDNINLFLTERMKQKNNDEQDDIERRILDDGVDEDDTD